MFGGCWYSANEMRGGDMRIQKRFLIGFFGVVLLAVVATGAFFGARSRGDGRPAEASSASSDLTGSAQVSAGANATSADPFVYQYAGEFLCGDTSTLSVIGLNPPLGLGVYNTEISIHNANAVPALIQKKVVPLPLASPEQVGSPTQRRRLTLQADEAFQIDCNDLASFFPAGAPPCNGGPLPQPTNAFCKGYVVVEGGKVIGTTTIIPAQLDMTITITVSDSSTLQVRTMSFELQPGKIVQYPCWSNGPNPPFPPPCP
jgi:hypothetical protein